VDIYILIYEESYILYKLTILTSFSLSSNQRDKTKKQKVCIYFFIIHIISYFNQIEIIFFFLYKIEIKLKEQKLLLLLLLLLLVVMQKNKLFSLTRYDVLIYMP
jgi:hypothetical protein